MLLLYVPYKIVVCNVIEDIGVSLIILLKTSDFTIFPLYLSCLGVKRLSRVLTGRYLSPSEQKPAARL